MSVARNCQINTENRYKDTRKNFKYLDAIITSQNEFSLK